MATDSIRTHSPSGNAAFVLKSKGMNDHPGAVSAVYKRCWKAIVRAFAPTAGGRATPGDGADTTLFGTAADPSRSRHASSALKDDFWNPDGESTDFADPDMGADKQRR